MVRVNIEGRFSVLGCTGKNSGSGSGPLLYYDEAQRAVEARMRGWEVVVFVGHLEKKVEVRQGELSEHATQWLNNVCPGWELGEVTDVRIVRHSRGYPFAVMQDGVEQSENTGTVVADGLEHAVFLLGGSVDDLDGMKLVLPMERLKDPEEEHLAQWSELLQPGSKVCVLNHLVVPWVGGTETPHILFGKEQDVYMDELHGL